MKSFDTEFKKLAEKTRLGVVERRDLRERVVAYMEYHPLPQSRVQFGATPSFSLGDILAWSTTHTRSLAGVFAFVFVVTVVPFAAERAVPGDVLYPIKTKVNETIRAQFADSPYEKVAFQTELLERRIAEARLLAKEGKLDKAAEDKIAVSVKNQADAVQKGIAVLKTSDAEEGAIAEIAFSSTLAVQSAALSGDEVDGIGGAGDGIIGAVRDAQATVDATRSASTPSYGRLAERVARELARAKEFSLAIDSAMTNTERTDIARRLSDVERKITEAERLATTTEPVAARIAATLVATSTEASASTTPASTPTVSPAAITTLSEALGALQKLILFMTDIDIRESVTIEKIVPVEFTKEERASAVRGAIDELENARAAYTEALARGVHADIASTTAAFEAKLAIASSTADMAEAEGAISAARLLLEKLGVLATESATTTPAE